MAATKVVTTDELRFMLDDFFWAVGRGLEAEVEGEPFVSNEGETVVARVYVEMPLSELRR